MKNSPCAKLIRRATPSMSASPAATMAYMAPSVRPCSSCSRRSEISVTWGPRNGPQTPKRSECPGPAVALLDHPSRSIEQGRARRQLFEDAQLAVAHLEQDHVDPGLVMVVELDRTERRVLDVDLLQRRADRLAIGVSLLLQRDLDRGHDGPLERDGREAAVDARRNLVTLGPLLVPVGIETGDPIAGLDDAVADLRVVAHLVQELGGRQAAARVDPLRQPELAVLPHERRAVAGQDDGEDGFRIGALEPRQDGPIVRLAGIEELGRDERDAGFLERRLVGDGGAATEVVVHREHRGGFHALARHVAGERMRHDLVVEGDAEGPLVAALAAELADLRSQGSGERRAGGGRREQQGDGHQRESHHALLILIGGPDIAPKPPNVRAAPAQPWRPSFFALIPPRDPGWSGSAFARRWA